MKAEGSRPPLVVCGLGYTGAAIAEAWTRAGGEVVSTLRSAAGHADSSLVAEFGTDGVPAPPALGSCLGVITFGTGGANPERAVQNAVDWLADAGAHAVCYLSSTSVYGDCDGAIVTESTPTEPTTVMGRKRVSAETRFLAACSARGVRAVILRMPGIYGPGRTPRERIIAGTYRFPRGRRWSNRIHLDDVAGAVSHVLNEGVSGVFNATDGTPFVVAPFLEWAAEELGVSAPEPVPFDELGERAKPFWRGNRRISNARLLATGWTPTVPDVREGHRRAWEAEAELSG